MHIEQFISRLEKFHQSNNDFEFSFGKSLQLIDITTIENRLNIIIPEKIKCFYFVANGLKTSNPDFELIPLDRWQLEEGMIHFSTFDNSIKIFFNTTELNQADEWTIINNDNNYIITYSISSFWSNKIWHWFEQKHKIWADTWWTN